MAPTRVVLSRRRGWRLPPGAKSVAKPTRWANPCAPKVRSPVNDAEAVRLYRVWLAERLAANCAFLEPLREATGLSLLVPVPPALPCRRADRGAREIAR